MALAALAAACAACAGMSDTRSAHKIDRVSRSGEAFFAFLQSPGKTLAEIREAMPRAAADSVYLVAADASNDELADYIQIDASDYPFEIFMRVAVSKDNQRVYRYIVKGDWRSVKMGYGSLRHPDFYDAIYLHTHPRNQRLLPNSISDYIHAESFRDVSTLLVADGIPIEFKRIARNADGVDFFEVDGREFSLERPAYPRVRTKEQMRREQRDADDAIRELDRIFKQNVKSGHERIALRNSEGMRVVYERDRTLAGRLNEVYLAVELPLPAGSDDAAANSEITHTPASDAPVPLGF